MILKIDQEFKHLIPILSKEDKDGLERNIIANGCETPITVWDGTIIDGHNRYEICIANGIPFEIKEISFADRDDAKIWMIKHELEWKGRRINEYIRSSLALKSKAILAEKAKRQHSLSGGDKKSEQYKEKSVVENSTPPINIKNDTKTRDDLAKLADVSSNTISRVEKIEEKATSEQREALAQGKISINKVFTEIKKQEEEKKRELEVNKQLKQTNFDSLLPSEPIDVNSELIDNLLSNSKPESIPTVSIENEDLLLKNGDLIDSELHEETKIAIEDVKITCPLKKHTCPKSHVGCDHWYGDGCNHEFDSMCVSGACSIPSAQKPNAKCPYCNHNLTIDYDKCEVIK